jgi:ubiquinone biosynthesis protein
MKERVSPRNIAKDFGSVFMSYLNLTKHLPNDLKEILNRLNRNKFKIDLEHRGLDRFINELDRSINRLSSSLILAALIVGTSLIMQTDRGPHLMGVPLLAFIGFVVAGFIGLWLVVAVFRSGRL